MPAANKAGNNLMEAIYGGPENLSNNEKMHAAYPETKPTLSNIIFSKPQPGISNNKHVSILEKKRNRLSEMNKTVNNHGINVRAHRIASTTFTPGEEWPSPLSLKSQINLQRKRVKYNDDVENYIKTTGAYNHDYKIPRPSRRSRTYRKLKKTRKNKARRH